MTEAQRKINLVGDIQFGNEPAPYLILERLEHIVDCISRLEKKAKEDSNSLRSCCICDKPIEILAYTTFNFGVEKRAHAECARRLGKLML